MKYNYEPGFAVTYLGEVDKYDVSVFYFDMTHTSYIDGPPARKRTRYLLSTFYFPFCKIMFRSGAFIGPT